MSEKNLSLFYFATIDRNYVIDKHKFYVAEASKRIFSQFNDSILEGEAKQKELASFEEVSSRFNPDYDDEGYIYETAHDVGVSHFLALNEMKNTVSLAMTAGIFHMFDKELRERCVRELSHWIDREFITSIIWNIGFPRLIGILEWVGMEIISKDYYKKINACRLIVNVYKHGEGDAHQELSTKYPEYYYAPWGNTFGFHHEQLEITEAQFIEIADAIEDFWKDIPVHCMRSNIREQPKWLVEKYTKYKTQKDKGI